jgi:hypothetical protein
VQAAESKEEKRIIILIDEEGELKDPSEAVQAAGERLKEAVGVFTVQVRK